MCGSPDTIHQSTFSKSPALQVKVPAYYRDRGRTMQTMRELTQRETPTMTVLEIEAIAEAIEANAPLRFAQTCHALGIHPNVVRGLMDAHPANARWLIQRLAGTKADKQADRKSVV